MSLQGLFRVVALRLHHRSRPSRSTVFGSPSVSLAEPVARDSNADSPNIGAAVAADAAGGCGAGKGDGPS